MLSHSLSISIHEETQDALFATTHVERQLKAVLDELDYGIVLVDGAGSLVHCNCAARAELEQDHPLRIADGMLRARRAIDEEALRASMLRASHRGVRCLLDLGDQARRVSASVVPLSSEDAGAGAPVMIVMGKSSLCEPLSLDAFARAHGLTLAETRVLAGLCAGSASCAIADDLNVAISTLRSHIGNLRAKVGGESIRSLVRRIAMLPPLRSVLQRRISNGRPCRPVESVSTG